MRNFLVVLILVVSASSLFAQNNELQIKTGIHYDLFRVANEDGKIKPAIMAPVVDINYTKYFDNNIFARTGLGFHNYSLAFKLDDFGGFNRSVGYSYDEAYLAAFVPLHVGYRFKLSEHFHLLLSMGADLEGYFNESENAASGSISGDHEFHLYREKLHNRLNVLLGSDVMFKYQSDNGFGIGAFVSYRTGLFRVFEAYGILSYNNGEDVYFPDFITHGSYFSSGISISIAF